MKKVFLIVFVIFCGIAVLFSDTFFEIGDYNSAINNPNLRKIFPINLQSQQGVAQSIYPNSCFQYAFLIKKISVVYFADESVNLHLKISLNETDQSSYHNYFDWAYDENEKLCFDKQVSFYNFTVNKTFILDKPFLFKNKKNLSITYQFDNVSNSNNELKFSCIDTQDFQSMHHYPYVDDDGVSIIFSPYYLNPGTKNRYYPYIEFIGKKVGPITQIGNGDIGITANTNTIVPFIIFPYHLNQYTQLIYTYDEFLNDMPDNFTKNISAIWLQKTVTNTDVTLSNVKIYVAVVPSYIKNNFHNNHDWLSPSYFTKVYDGNLTLKGNQEWCKIPFNQIIKYKPKVYNTHYNTHSAIPLTKYNMVLAFLLPKYSSSISNYNKFICHNIEEGKSLKTYTPYNFDPAEDHGVLLDYRPNIIFEGYYSFRREEESAEESIPEISENNLFQNFPNPFNPSTSISYQLKNDQFVTLIIYNLKGEKIKTLVNRKMNKGIHTITWDGKDEKNKPVPSGVYFYKIISDEFKQTKKMLLLK